MIVKNSKGLTKNTEKVYGIEMKYNYTTDKKVKSQWFLHKTYKTMPAMLQALRDLRKLWGNQVFNTPSGWIIKAFSYEFRPVHAYVEEELKQELTVTLPTER